jgi:UDP-glucose 4-epimerase
MHPRTVRYPGDGLLEIGAKSTRPLSAHGTESAAVGTLAGSRGPRREAAADERNPRVGAARIAPSLDGARCLVLGGGGFLGRALSTALCDRGAVVRGFGHPPPEGEAVDRRVHWLDGEFSDLAAVRRAIDGREIVFHLLGSSIPELADLDVAEDLTAHVYWTVKLLDACLDAKVRRLVFASSGGAVYGIPSLIPTPETAATEPISAYGTTRLAIERYLALYHHRHGLDYHVLRIGNAYGPGQSPFRRQGVVAATLYRALAGHALEIWGAGETTRDFIHVDDVVEAFLDATQYAGAHRVMNVGCSEGRSLDDVVADVKLLLNIPAATVVRKPRRPVDIPVSILDTALIRGSTPWRPHVAWPDGLAETTGWLRARYRL